jgi:hypothetical protein
MFFLGNIEKDIDRIETFCEQSGKCLSLPLTVGGYSMMESTKSAIVFLAVSCLCLLVLSFKNADAQNAEIKPGTKYQGGRVLSLRKMLSDESKLTTATIEPGTTVIWFNNTRRVVEVEFIDKQVTLVCGAPVGFFINEEGSFTSQKIIPNAVASLCFLEKGEFDFEVLLRTLRGADPLKGKRFKRKIVVE